MIFDFLKLNLSPIDYHKGENIGYGISYRIETRIMIFFGRVDKDIKNKKVVVQIMSKRGLLLRELTIRGDESTVKELNSSEIKLSMNDTQ